jgi:hypothetical protein
MYTLEDQPETATDAQTQIEALDQVISELYAQPVADDPQWIQDTAEA